MAIKTVNPRGSNVAPGIYVNEQVINASVKSLGVTTLGVAGLTKTGPAFQPTLVESWGDFLNKFGGTDPTKYKGSQYPKYELPYIAKDYLTESKQLYVSRVLGLAGTTAGAAWCITAQKGSGTSTTDKTVIAVLRSRGHYEAYDSLRASSAACDCPAQAYDVLRFDVGETNGQQTCTEPKKYNMDALKIKAYNPFQSNGNECEGYEASAGTQSFAISSLNPGKFTLSCLVGSFASGQTPGGANSGSTVDYAVSLNPADKDYILKVLGSSPQDGDAHIYVESLYDVALDQMIQNREIDHISDALETYQPYLIADYCNLAPVYDIMYMKDVQLSRKDVGKRFLAGGDASSYTYTVYDDATGLPSGDTSGNVITSAATVGYIYTVVQYTDSNGKRFYYNRNYKDDNLVQPTAANIAKCKQFLVKSSSDNYYYRINESGNDLARLSCDLSNYKSAYRFASTPWFVSNVMGDATQVKLAKMFRFHTISDGSDTNGMFKVSITNIRPDQGQFDVVIRDFNDTDESPVILERFSKCTMTPGDNNYISYKIGSYDGSYEVKSNYVTVETIESDTTRNAVPAGFLGYPVSNFAGVQVMDTDSHTEVKNPVLRYNTNYDVDIKNKRQYFGLSSIVGIDVDAFTFKGVAAYGETQDYLTHGFHLDCRIGSIFGQSVLVDGEPYVFDAVSINNRTNILDGAPIIASEADMEGSIYEDINLRKFTACFFGGYDGFDEYRDYLTATDDFQVNKYKGVYSQKNGEGYSFDKIANPGDLGLTGQCITSDWYAYLAAVRQFANPSEVEISVLATPGIDAINNTLLVQEILDMVEEERGDCIYPFTIPDRPWGAGEYVDEMYTPDEIVEALEDTEIDSSYACTYYPWAKYLDSDNNQYVMLPVTRDMVRNFAATDNVNPFYAPAGIKRGKINAVRPHFVTKQEDQNTLYAGRINPLKSFSDGLFAWGQKNLQTEENQLDRIAIRRSLLRIKKLISQACMGLIFDPNDATVQNSFRSLVNPILDNIKSQRGITDYYMVIDNSVESRDRRELNVVLYLKMPDALEYINISFVVTPEGVSFNDI
jgi:hypothetical protein